MFLRGVANTLDPVTRVRPVPGYGQIDYKTSGCLDGLVINGNTIAGCGRATYNALQLSATRRFRSGFTGGFQYQYSTNQGTTQGSNEAATTQNTFDFDSEYGTNPQDIPHTFNGSLIYQIPGEGALRGGWRAGSILNGRSGVPINVIISRPDNTSVNGVTVANIVGGNSRGTQRPDLVAGVDRPSRPATASDISTPPPSQHRAGRRQPPAQPPAWTWLHPARSDVRQGPQVLAEPHGRPRHRPADAGLHPLLVLTSEA